MNTNNKEEIRVLIEKELAKTLQVISSYKDMSQPVEPDNAIGRVSRMDAINNKSITEAALRKAQEKLSNLKEVKLKIDNVDFGLCVKCKQPIPIGRLILMPQSRRCVNCAR